ncbi:MAG: hypothetical protein QM655_00195 [Nocardioidaceae bacterium]
MMNNWFEIGRRSTMTSAYPRALFAGIGVGVVVDEPRNATHSGTHVWSPPL